MKTTDSLANQFLEIVEMSLQTGTTTINPLNTTMTSKNMNSNLREMERVPEIQKDFVIWAIVDGILIFLILFGNILTILAVRYSHRLRSVISNHFVLSLAIADILVGLSLPYHLAFYINMSVNLGENKGACLLRFFFVIFACCVSIWNLIAIAVDRYIAICYPLHYGRYMTRKVALVLMSGGWLVGFFIAAIPICWNNWDSARECEFDQIFHKWYLAGVITPIFSLVWFTLIFVYWRIWREASKHVKQLRITGIHDGPSDWKSVQVVLLILGGFSICWLPYFVVACAQIFKLLENGSPTVYKAAFSLAMSNSAMNPLIYAWKNSNFRIAFGRLLRCKNPDTNDNGQSIRSNLHRKSSSVHHQDTINGNFPNYSTPPIMQRKAIQTTTILNDQHLNDIEITIEDVVKATQPKTVIVNDRNESELQRVTCDSLPELQFIEINKKKINKKPEKTTNGTVTSNKVANVVLNKCAIYENYIAKNNTNSNNNNNNNEEVENGITISTN